MTFTYDGTDLSTDLAKLRLSVGDTVASEGPRPGNGTNTNFTDEELTLYLGLVSTWREATALVLDLLSAQWASQASSVRMGDYSEDAKAKSAAFAEAADNVRQQIQEASDEIVMDYFEESDSGKTPPHYFGLEQWGADVKDNKLT